MEKMSKEQLDRLQDIPGIDGWYKDSLIDIFNSHIRPLVEKGFSIDAAIGYLESVWSTVSGYYGD